MSEHFAYLRTMDGDDIALLRKRLNRLLIAIQTWTLESHNGMQTLVDPNSGSSMRNTVRIQHPEDNAVVIYFDGENLIETHFMDVTKPKISTGSSLRNEAEAFAKGWIACAENTFSTHSNLTAKEQWLAEIKSAKALAAAVLKSIGFTPECDIVLPTPLKPIAFGEGNYGVEGGVFTPQMNDFITKIAPKTLVINYEACGGTVHYTFQSSDELPDPLAPEIGVEDWPDPVQMLRIMSQIHDVPRPWTYLMAEAHQLGLNTKA